LENYILGLLRDKIKKALKNNDIRSALSDWNRTVLVKLPEFNFSIISKDGIVEVNLEEVKDPDIVMEMRLETLIDLIHDKITPMNAYSRRKVKVKASLQDLRLLSRIL